MKHSILKITIIACMLYCGGSKAQVSSYAFTQTLSNYGSSTTGTMLGTNFQDDDVNQVNLPFNFNFNGTTYNTINVCANGYLSFDPVVGNEYSALSHTVTTNVIAPFAQDLFMGSVKLGDLSAGSNSITNVSSTIGLNVGDSLHNFSGDFASTPVIISIQGNVVVVSSNALGSVSPYALFAANGRLIQNVTGIAPSRICEFEFMNMTRYGIFNEMINFKVKLHEGTNKVEVVYGNIFADSVNVPAEVGLKGSNNSDFNSRTVIAPATWATSGSAGLISDACEFSDINFPANGLSFVWTPTFCVTPSITVAQSSPSICAGTSATLTASGATTFTWSNGSTSAKIVESPSQTTTYTISSSNSSCGSSTTVTLYVNPLPVLGVVQSNTLLCSGKSAMLTATGVTSYKWSTGATIAGISISPVTSTSYTLTGSDGNCENTKVITQQVAPTPVLTIIQSKTLTCKGQNSTLTVSGADTYTWSNGVISNSIIIKPNSTSIYTVNGSTGGCFADRVITQSVSACTAIDESKTEEMNFSAYPNPFVNTLSIKSDNGSRMILTISNTLGSVVYSGTIEEAKTETISTDEFAPGLYIVSLSDEYTKVTKKIIKK